MQVAIMVQAGVPARTDAEQFSFAVRVNFKWVLAFTEHGQNALLAREGAVRPPKVITLQLQWIADVERDKTPDQPKFEFGLWALHIIGQIIERQLTYFINYSC